MGFGEFILRCVDVDYPRRVHILHAIYAVADYRKWRSSEGEPTQLLYDMVASYFCCSQGGGTLVATLVDGIVPLRYILNKDHALAHLVAYLCVYWGPKDAVFRLVQNPKSLGSLLCKFMDSLDLAAGLCGMIDAGVKKHPGNPFVPVFIGNMLYNSGSLYRWLDTRMRGKPAKIFIAQPGSGVTRATFLSLLYWYAAYSQKRRDHRDYYLKLIVIFEITVQMAEAILDFDAYEAIHQQLCDTLVDVRASVRQA